MEVPGVLLRAQMGELGGQGTPGWPEQQRASGGCERRWLFSGCTFHPCLPRGACARVPPPADI